MVKKLALFGWGVAWRLALVLPIVLIITLIITLFFAVPDMDWERTVTDLTDYEAVYGSSP